MLTKNKTLAILFLILIFGSALRLSYLDYNPPSLNWDEVSHGYNAYSILKTGKDEWGKFFPMVNFRAYGDYPTALNLYLTIPFIAIFGLNEFAIRLPHAFLGILTIASVYFLVLGLFKNKKIALLASFLAAIEPWYVFTSRFVIQSNLSVFLLTSCMAMFFNRDKNKYLLPLSLFFLFLTLFSYHSTRIFSPPLLVAILFLYKREFIVGLAEKRKTFIASAFFVLLFIILLPVIFLNKDARARSRYVFLINEGSINKIIESRLNSKLPPLLTRLTYNRPTYFIKEFVKNYIDNFSPNFLFLTGGTQYQFSVPNHGLLYLINLPFFYLGLILLLKKVMLKEKNFQFLFIWLLLSPIPASITNEKFAVLRATTMLPLPQILVSLGFFWILERVKKSYSTLFLSLYLIILVLSLDNYMFSYFTDYRTNYSWSWQYGYRQVVDYAKKNYNNYDKIIVTKEYGEPHEFFLFYWPWDPEEYRNDPNLIRFYQSSWYWVDRFDKFYFVNDWQVKALVLESGGSIDCSTTDCLLITSPENVPEGWKKLRTINFLYGKPVFDIYEN